jgi:putative transcriptional regulator
MIKCNLSILMGKEKMNIQDVCNATGLARNTVGNLYRDTATRVDYNTIDVLCELFQCEVSELFSRSEK